MPWYPKGSGYTTRKGGFSYKPKMYEDLRQKGYSKAKASAITNAKAGLHGRKGKRGRYSHV